MKTSVLLQLSFVCMASCLPIGCEISPLTFRAPLIVHLGTTTLINPEQGQSLLKFPTKAIVEFSCPGGQVTTNETSLGVLVNATCKSGGMFYINEQIVSWSSITCSNNNIQPDVREVQISQLREDSPNIICHDTNSTLKILQIGFILEPGRFSEVIEICFNSATKIPTYAFYILPSSINHRARSVETPSFRQDDTFYRMGKSIRHMYRSNQTTINSLLGLDVESDKYINARNFISRGHLAARADFMYGPLQRATYRYINVAPQWNAFNGGNWNQIEIAVRSYADKYKLNLYVWTGTRGHSRLINEDTTKSVDLFLYVDHTDRRHSPGFPVPEIFWKIIYDPVSKKGLLFVGHNNPYENVTEKHCNTDISDKVTWVNWNRNNVRLGVSYACHYNDSKFHRLDSVIPKLKVTGLLL